MNNSLNYIKFSKLRILFLNIECPIDQQLRTKYKNSIIKHSIA